MVTCTEFLCNAGKCSVENDEINCECMPGFTGERCEDLTNRCDAESCDPGYICQNLLTKIECNERLPDIILPEDLSIFYNRYGVYILSTAGIIFICVCILWVIIFLRCNKPGKAQTSRARLRKPVKLFSWLKSGFNALVKMDHQTADSLAFLKSQWNIDESSLTFGHMIDSGQFANIFVGYLSGRGKARRVALKTVKHPTRKLDCEEILNEFETLATLQPHRNITTLLGVCFRTTPQPLTFLVLEHCALGNLRDFLLSLRFSQQPGLSVSGQMLVDFCFGIVRGMKHVRKLGYVHRDLAARNVLLTSTGCCRICDFGLARRASPAHDCNYLNVPTQEANVHTKRLYIRWMAPESVSENIYSAKSDIWSFGIVMWEIVTLAAVPYPNMTDAEVKVVLSKSYKMPKPQHCSNEWYGIMTSCWPRNPKIRPTFTTLYKDIRYIKVTGKGLPNMSMYTTQNYLPCVPLLEGKVQENDIESDDNSFV